MARENEKLGIETVDFITPRKAITISTISMVTWFITGLSFKLLSVFFVNIPYQSYALVVSLSLSVLFSIYIVRKLVMKADLFMKIIIGMLNTILIYTSANGAQATYSFLSPSENKSKSVTTQTLSLIPFIDARPWIPDKFLMAENETLTKDNKRLLEEKADLAKQLESLQARIQQFNTRQGIWSQTIAGNAKKGQRAASYLLQDPAVAIKQQVNKLIKDSTYYDFLFLTPINPK